MKTFNINKGFTEYQIKDRKMFMEAAPYVSGVHLMVPLCSIAESIGGGVKWNAALKAWQIFNRDSLESAVDIMGDGTKIKDKLKKSEKVFIDGDYAYLSSLRDGASIYRSNKDGSRPERMLNHSSEIISVNKNYIIFIDLYEKNKLYRMKKDGTGLEQFISDSVFNVSLNGDVIKYYCLKNGVCAYSIKTDGTAKQLLNEAITVKSGDWNVNGNEIVSGKTILLKGNLIVSQGNSLTLEDTHLIFDTDSSDSSKIERNIEIQKGSLIMKGSEIRTTGLNNGIRFKAEYSKIQIENCTISDLTGQMLFDVCDNVICTGNYVIDDAKSGFVFSSRVNGALYKDNIIINRDRDRQTAITFHSTFSRNLTIKDNVCVNQGECMFFQQGTGGLVSGNLILGDNYWLGLSLRHDAGNTTYDNNFLQLNYDDGYRINNWSNNNAINSDSVESTSVFSRNVVNNSSNPMRIQNMRNGIYDSNRVWMQLYEAEPSRKGYTAVNMQYAHNCEIINNSFESWNGGSAIQAFYCSENRIASNTFTGFCYGAEFWNKSDGNIIEGNRVVDCNSSILTNGSEKNLVQNNVMLSTKNANIKAYNAGQNSWKSNFYSDWKTSSPRNLISTGVDATPLLKEPTRTKAQSKYPFYNYDYSTAFTESRQNIGNGSVADNQVWKDQTIYYNWHDFTIKNGGTLTLENVTLYSPKMFNSEPEINVSNGGKLIMKNCRIIADPKRMTFMFRISPGGTFIAEDCTFANILELTMNGERGRLKNCTFIDCYMAANVGGHENEIMNCRVEGSFLGIILNPWAKSKSSGNVLKNIAADFDKKVTK